MASTRNINGVLAVPASVTGKKGTASVSTSKMPPRSAVYRLRLRLIIRRLPPGLTEAEFREILGDEWSVGAGKVIWFAYKEGKISKEWVLWEVFNQFADRKLAPRSIQDLRERICS